MGTMTSQPPRSLLLLIASLSLACASSGAEDGESLGSNDDEVGEDAETGETGETGETSETSEGETSGGGSDTPGGLDRPADPVVVLGAQLPALTQVDAGEVVGFARQDGAWLQVPVQVDERAVQDFCEIYGKSSGLWNGSPACKTDQVVTALFYADEGTFMGADPEPTLDADDELAFMARDAGDRIESWTEPDGVVAGSGVELELLDGDERAYLYLFARDGEGLDPGAGAQYVSYDFALDGGVDYFSDYDLYGYNCGGFDATCDPSMTEDSTVQGANYSHHFSARWVSDELRITAGDATGVDILDIHQNRFSPESCGRHVLTFSTAEGAYVINHSGPVRALRSYIGANSGPLTQRFHRFYDQREDVVTLLRVHSLGAGIMDLFDYSAEAVGMTYYSDLHPEGLAIDGAPEAVNDADLQSWEFVTGEQGSLVMTNVVDASFDVSPAHFYWVDDEDPAFHQCDTSTVLDAPDASALGTSGVWIEMPLPDTDPKNGSSEHLMVERVIYFREPGLAVDEAMELVDDAQAQIQAYARTIDAEGRGADCGDGECSEGEASSCAMDCAPVDGSCGDSICEPPENSTSCLADCPNGGGGGMGAECGNGACDGVENQLSCAPDCWAPFGNQVACVEANCEGLLDACADEQECVDVTVCVGSCVAGGGALNACLSDCAAQVMPAQVNLDTANAMFACGNMAGCF